MVNYRLSKPLAGERAYPLPIMPKDGPAFEFFELWEFAASKPNGRDCADPIEVPLMLILTFFASGRVRTW